jgi:aminopeptidase N
MTTYRVTLRADAPQARCCCPTATCSRNAICRMAATKPSGKTRSASRHTCSRWWPASSSASRKPSFRLGQAKLLQVWVEPQDLDKTRHAMDSLIHAIRWDEQRFGLELDLDRFMIVAVGDFNMGAMENKGLNIFNTKYVLANAQTATDVDFANIESVVATSTSTTGPATA